MWTDARTVNVLGKACASKSIQIAVVAINFFLGIEMRMNEDEDQQEAKAMKEVADVNKHEHSKKTKKRARLVEKQTERNKKLRREQEKKANDATPLFPAIQLLNDPQGLAEKLFQRARSSNEKFEVRLLVLNFVSRLIGCHQLVLLSPTRICNATSRAINRTSRAFSLHCTSCHDLVPPEELVPVVKTVAHNFITERCSNNKLQWAQHGARDSVETSSIPLEEDG